jgi:transcriptional regulator NrdR family protein
MPKKSGKTTRKKAVKKKITPSRKTRTVRKATKPKNTVIRRTSGRKEKFDKEKMVQTVSRLGTPYLMARDVAKTVSRNVARNRNKLGKRKGQEIEIDGNVVRKMVMEELKDRNRSDIASSVGGESPESTRQERHGMMNTNEPVPDNIAANRTKLLFDNSTRFAKNTKRQG